ncbi:MAG: zinc-ribbon domain-containing protein [Candidatus Heimdallarchaeum endolithica]|uniref:Zinc-ribbon domain-containing protein n=1 Tax=Candidatus Heimdallarchaeum endolithica TaxID=2876572 RepID=A0A9Y1BU36_9ARCH|nr:MAG: zinc-ribbon domain-containing protein [Candidatus Heimdallarchaeum endolithica]
MHKGFITRELTSEEISHKKIFIKIEDRVLFPRGIFFIDYLDNSFGVYLSDKGFLEGLEQWFNEFPSLKKGDIIIIAKHSSGFSLNTTSPIVQSQISLIMEMQRVQMLTVDDILCPNCYYSLEEEKLPKNSPHLLKLKCSRCGFILIKTKI